MKQEQIDLVENLSNGIMSNMSEGEKIQVSRAIDVTYVINNRTRPIYSKICNTLAGNGLVLEDGFHNNYFAHFILEIIYYKLRNQKFNIRTRYKFWKHWLVQSVFPLLLDKNT